MSAQVINFEKLGRRKAIARLTKNYAPVLAHVLGHAMLNDGTHFDENDLPMVRPLDRSESRHGAVANAAVFFAGLICTRARFETPAEGPDDLHAFAYRAVLRQKRYYKEHLGDYKIVVSGTYKRDLQMIELNYARAVFDALKVEAASPRDFNETEFWADVFRGFSDPDSSGVVLRAAGLVLLDHLPQFQAALSVHTHGAEQHALGEALRG